MDQSGARVTITHLGRDLTLVSYEERARQRGVLAKRAVARTGGTGSKPRQDVGRRLLLLMGSRPVGRRRRCRNDHGRREYQRQRRMISAGPEQCRGERGRGRDNRDPAVTAETGEQAAGV